MECPRCGGDMSGGVCSSCGFPMTGIRRKCIANYLILNINFGAYRKCRGI